MAILLMNLRNVPEDEADGIRALLESSRIAFYETPPNRWGISAGGIWLQDDSDLDEARRLLAEFQAERAARARKEPPPPLRPLKLIVYLFFVLFILYVSIWPFIKGF